MRIKKGHLARVALLIIITSLCLWAGTYGGVVVPILMSVGIIAGYFTGNITAKMEGPRKATTRGQGAESSASNREVADADQTAD